MVNKYETIKKYKFNMRKLLFNFQSNSVYFSGEDLEE